MPEGRASTPLCGVAPTILFESVLSCLFKLLFIMRYFDMVHVKHS